MKAKTIEIVNAYGLFNGVKFHKIEDNKAISSGMRIMKAFRKVSDEYNEFMESTVKKLRPENYDEVEAVLKNREGHTPEEIAKAVEAEKEYANRIEECLMPEAQKEVELDIPYLTDEQHAMLVSASEWNGAQSLFISDLTVE